MNSKMILTKLMKTLRVRKSLKNKSLVTLRVKDKEMSSGQQCAKVMESDLSTKERNLTMIFYAIQNNDTELLKNVLLRFNHVNELNEDGISAIHFASIVGRTTCVKMLVENGANVHNTDERGRTALQYAITMNKVDTIAYLKSVNI